MYLRDTISISKINAAFRTGQQLELQQADLRSLQKNPVNSSDKAKELVQRFVESACASRELLVSLVDRIELTQDKQLIIHFRIPELQDFSL